MRSFTLVLLLSLAVALASLVPTTSAGVSMTFYSDIRCTQLVGEPYNIPLKSSPTCQDVSDPDGPASATFTCSLEKGLTIFTFVAWEGNTKCSGKFQFSIASDAKTGSCAFISIDEGNGPVTPVFGKVACDSSVDESEPADSDSSVAVAGVAETMRAVRRTAALAARMTQIETMGGRRARKLSERLLHQ